MTDLTPFDYSGRQVRTDLAERDIKKYGRGKAPETDEYLRRNKAVVDAEKGVPWWRR